MAYLITTDLKLPHLLRHSFKPRALSLRQLSTVEPNRAVRPADAPDNRAASWNYDIYADKAGKYRWRALSSNGQNVGSGGESFSSKSSAQTAADNVKTKAGGATGP